jgi:hypothetical protein
MGKVSAQASVQWAWYGKFCALRLTFFVSVANYSSLRKQFSNFSSAQTSGNFLPQEKKHIHKQQDICTSHISKEITKHFYKVLKNNT